MLPVQFEGDAVGPDPREIPDLDDFRGRVAAIPVGSWKAVKVSVAAGIPEN